MYIRDCPFCFSIDTQIISSIFKVCVVCMDCEAQGPPIYLSSYYIKNNKKLRIHSKAIAAWNNRTYKYIHD